MMMAKDQDGSRDASPSIAGRAQSGNSGGSARDSPRNAGLLQSRGAQSQGRTSDKLLQMMMAKDAM